MRDKADFIENLKLAHTHLLVLTEDIKYPLSEERQKWLNGATFLIGHLQKDMIREDIEAALKTIGEQQSEAEAEEPKEEE